MTDIISIKNVLFAAQTHPQDAVEILARSRANWVTEQAETAPQAR
jgi:hypothetical protein